MGRETRFSDPGYPAKIAIFWMSATIPICDTVTVTPLTHRPSEVGRVPTVAYIYLLSYLAASLDFIVLFRLLTRFQGGTAACGVTGYYDINVILNMFSGILNMFSGIQYANFACPLRKSLRITRNILRTSISLSFPSKMRKVLCSCTYGPWLLMDNHQTFRG